MGCGRETIQSFSSSNDSILLPAHAAKLTENTATITRRWIDKKIYRIIRELWTGNGVDEKFPKPSSSYFPTSLVTALNM